MEDMIEQYLGHNPSKESMQHTREQVGMDETDDGLVGMKHWFVDGAYTHGVTGLACVSVAAYGPDAPHIGPDYELDGTPKQVVAWLEAGQFSDLETDDADLARAWTEYDGDEHLEFRQ
jgi:hypothetical protein